MKELQDLLDKKEAYERIYYKSMNIRDEPNHAIKKDIDKLEIEIKEKRDKLNREAEVKQERIDKFATAILLGLYSKDSICTNPFDKVSEAYDVAEVMEEEREKRIKEYNKQ